MSTFARSSAQAVPGTVHMISGCRDKQTSADASNTASFELPADAGPGGAGGACTSSMMKVLLGDGAEAVSWVSLLERMRTILEDGGYTQVPQLSSSRQLSLSAPFSVVNEGETGCGSRALGRKRALLIGINYVGQQGELRGCHNDVETMGQYVATQGFDDVKVLLDDGICESPTFDAIVSGFAWLTDGAAEGDSLFLHYSGHGGSVPDASGDERDGRDETLVPLDFKTKGQITDDLVLSNLVLAVPKGAMLTAVIDACHSGTVLDLPYQFVASAESLSQVHSGALPDQMQESPDFNFGQLLRVGKMLQQMMQDGASKQEIAQAALGGLKSSGALEAAKDALAEYTAGGGGKGACPCVVQ
jgi:hypothetical protein